MADEERKAVAVPGAPTTKAMPHGQDIPSSEQRRMQDALEDDEVREALKKLHEHPAKRD